MALTTCKVCGGKMSDRATECPHCGATQEQQQELKAKERKNYIWLVVAAILWLGALFIIVDTLIGERWSRICGDLPNGGFEWFRCEMNLLVAPFIVAAIIAVIGFLICHKSKKTILIGSFSSLVGIAILSGIVYFLSDTYNYKEDQYSDWYRDNVIFDFSNEENFAELINGTAWVDNNGEAAFVFKDNKVYLAAAKKGGGWLIGEGTYSKRDYQSALELKNIYIDNTTYNGTFRSRRCELTSWRGSLEMNNFHRLHKSELSKYGFDRDVIDLVTLVPEYGEDPIVSSKQDEQDRLESLRQDSIKQSEFANNFVDINVFVERKYVDWDANLKVPEFKDNIEEKLVELGYKSSNVKRGTREGEGGEYYNYKVTTYEKNYSGTDKNAPWSKVICDDGVCGGYTIYFYNKDQLNKFLESCKKLGYTKRIGRELYIPMPEKTLDGDEYYSDNYHENGNCVIIVDEDHVKISFGCV